MKMTAEHANMLALQKRTCGRETGGETNVVSCTEAASAQLSTQTRRTIRCGCSTKPSVLRICDGLGEDVANLRIDGSALSFVYSSRWLTRAPHCVCTQCEVSCKDRHRSDFCANPIVLTLMCAYIVLMLI